MVGALQSFFYMHHQKIWFVKLIEEALDYDEFEVDSDNDTVDALGIALMKAIDMEQVAFNEGDLLENKPFEYPEWGEEGGNMINSAMKSLNEKEPLGVKEDYFSRMARIQLNQGLDEDDGLIGDIYDL